ncbi:MAG TPA: pentapeptide repeat-containing protein [Ktedonobacteraceae bacterium]|nr:pentapeptide repeat-containing protein [Ktedonobacteraceae bacterium]
MDERALPALSVDQSPATREREEWQAYWARHEQPWRTEPEIEAERQEELRAHLSIVPDVERGVYPFSQVKLSRADIEWLLANHEDGRGPVDYHDPRQRERVGLDLRGADLSYTNLQKLPLARTIGDVTWRTWENLTEKQHRMAALQLQHTDLKGAFLEGASLEYAVLDGADLRGCHLEEANLGSASLLGAYCEGAHLEGADLWYARLDGAFLWRVHLQGARLFEAHLPGAHLNGLILADKRHVGPLLVDTHWEDANLAVVDWKQVHILGDEQIALQRERDGRPKARATRIQEFEEAVRANRQLAVILQAQGLNEDANRFAYRAQVLQRKLLALRGVSKLGPYLFSLILALLTGYGHRMWRIVVAYALLISLFATLYYIFGLSNAPRLTGMEAVVLSITAFHGRVFSSPFQLGSPQGVVTAVEAITGLLFEGIFIAMLTQRFFGR